MTKTPIDIEALKKDSNPIRAIADHYGMDLGHAYMVADSFLPRNAGGLTQGHRSSMEAAKEFLGGEGGPAYRHFISAVETLVDFHVAKYPKA